MSAAATSDDKHIFVIWAPDYADEEALARRLKARSAHLERWKGLKESGFQKLGGPTLTAESIANADAEKKMIGSVIIVSAKTIEEVRDVVNSDPYWVGDVWDREKLVINPIILHGL